MAAPRRTVGVAAFLEALVRDAQQPRDRLARLRADAEPILDAIFLEPQLLAPVLVRNGRVGPELLEVLAVALAFDVRGHDPVVREVPAPVAREA